MSILGKRIRYLREKKNYSQVKVADDLGLSNVQLSRYESGDRNPDPELIAAFANYFEVTTDYLHGLTNSQSGFVVNYSKADPPNMDSNNDSFAEIKKLIKKYGIEQMGFFDIEQWKNLSPDDVLQLEEHFESIVKYAKKRNAKNED